MAGTKQDYEKLAKKNNKIRDPRSEIRGAGEYVRTKKEIKETEFSRVGPTSGPCEKYFARFETFFNALSEEEKAESVSESPRHFQLLEPEDQVTRDLREATRVFFTEFLARENGDLRGDYKELAHLVMVSKSKLVKNSFKCVLASM